MSIHMETPAAVRIDSHGPAGFWIRSLAAVLDFVVLTPIIALVMLATYTDSQSLLVAALLFSTVAGYAYILLFLTRSGQTLGKRAVGIRVIRAKDDLPIGWPEAIKRTIAQANFGVLKIFVGVWNILVLSPVEYSAMPPAVRQTLANQGTTYRVLDAFTYAWLFASIVTLFTNPRRRSLHDYIGGTAVVVLPPPKPRAVI